MSAPLIWIVFPGVLAILAYPVRRWQRPVTVAGVLAALGLAGLSLWVTIGKPISFGPFSGLPILQVSSTLTILGRRFILDNDYRPVLTLIYLGIAFWFGGSYRAQASRLFVPVGLGMAALLVAALAVEPFLYAALLIEMAALLSVPLLSPPGKPLNSGVLRFVSLQTLGVPFILFTGWLLSGVEANPADSTLVLRAAALMGLGFTFFAAIFPFHTWIPMLAEQAPPYAAAFIFYMLPTVVTLFGLGFLDRYIWLRSTSFVYESLRLLGGLMVVIGGVMAAFQRHLGRMMGYAAVMEIGLALLALSLGFSQPGSAPLPADSQLLGADIGLLGIFFAQFLPRSLGLALWALALATLQGQSPDLRFRAVQGLARRMPLASASLALAQLSLAGFPLLAGFPVRVALWMALSQQALPIAVLALIGSGGLLIGGLRTIAVLLTSPAMPEEPWQIQEDYVQRVLLSVGSLSLFLVGLMPQWFLPALANIANVFGRRAP